MSKEEFLKRCETIYDMRLTDSLCILRDYAEATERFLGYQKEIFNEIIQKQRHRQEGKYLANDRRGYNAVLITYILTNPCLECATNKDFSHRTTAFCNHELEDKF